MLEETKVAYRKLADYHFKKMGALPVYSNVKAYLELLAKDLRPDYFRRLRNAMALVQEEAGYSKNAKQINSIKNPVTANRTSKKNDGNIKVKKKQKRVQHLSDEELILIKNTLHALKDKTLFSVFSVIDILGCRPAEVVNLKILKDNRIWISGAKKTKSGQRGLDRIIELPVPGYKYICHHIKQMRNTDDFSVKKYQDKLKYQMKKLFPRRQKHRPNFYTLRHMMGTKLKNSDLTTKQVAYLMGHQSTASVEKYGDKRNSVNQTCLPIKPGVNDKLINSVVRDKTTDYERLNKSKKPEQSINNSPDIA